MASGSISATSTIGQVTGLSNGKTYIGQNRGPDILLITEVTGSTAPTLDSAHWFEIKPAGWLTMKPVATDTLWVYANGAAEVVYSED